MESNITPLLPRTTSLAALQGIWWMPAFLLAWLLALYFGFEEPTALVHANWPLIPVGFIGAVIGNATAVGGGLVFVPVMMLVYDLDPVTSLKLAIATQAFGMTSGAIGWCQQGTLAKRGLIYTVPMLLVGCIVGTLVIQPTASLVKGVFGPTSMAIGFFILYMRNRDGIRTEVPTHAQSTVAVVSFLGGLLTAWVAIGAGEVIGAFLMLAYAMRVNSAIGLGVVLMSISSIFLLFLHQVSFGDIPWEMSIFTILGCVYGARLGPHIGRWLDPKHLKLGFAIIAITDGALLVGQFLRQ